MKIEPTEPTYISPVNQGRSQEHTIPGTAAQMEPGRNKIVEDDRPIDIPEFQFRFSSTYFRAATKKDVLVKKFMNANNKDAKLMDQ